MSTRHKIVFDTNPFSEAHRYRDILAELFRACPVNELVTYAEMSKALGFAVHERRHLILNALAMVGQQDGIQFGVVRSMGYRRLAAHETHVLGVAARRRGRRLCHVAAHRIERTLQLTNDMPEDAKRAAYREIAGLRLMEHAGSDRIATKIEKATPADRPMSVAETLRATFANLGIHPRTAKKKAPAA